MPNTPSSAAIQEVRATILKLSQSLDTVETTVMTDLGFSDVPGWWAGEAEIVLASIARSARQAAVQQIRGTVQSIRVRSKPPSEELSDRIIKFHEELWLMMATLEELYVLANSELGPEFRAAIRDYVPQLLEKLAAFRLELSPLRTTIRQLLPVYMVLESPEPELEATLHTLFSTNLNLHENVICQAVDAVRLLATLKTRRQTLLEQETNLVAVLTSSIATIEERDHAWNELSALVKSLGIEVVTHGINLVTVSDAARLLQNDFPVLRAVLHGRDVTVQDLLEAHDKHRQLVEKVDELSKRVNLLTQTLDCLKNLVDLQNRLAGRLVVED